MSTSLPHLSYSGDCRTRHIWVLACSSCLSPLNALAQGFMPAKNNNKIPPGHPLQWPPLIYSTTQREARHWGRTKRGSGQHFLSQSCPCSMSGELKATLPFLLRTQKRLGPAKVFLSQYLGKRFCVAPEKEVRGREGVEEGKAHLAGPWLCPSSPGLGPPAEMTGLWEMVQGCWGFQPRGKQCTPGTLG